MKVHEVTRPPFRAVTAWGSHAELETYVRSVARAGALVQAAEPQPMNNGLWLRRMVLWEVAEQVQGLPAGPSALPARRRLTPMQRRVALRGGLLVGGLAAVAAVIWLIARAVSAAFSAAGSWVGGNRTVALLAVGVLAIIALLPLTRGKSRGGSRAGCPGLVHHCNGCRDHR